MSPTLAMPAKSRWRTLQLAMTRGNQGECSNLGSVDKAQARIGRPLTPGSIAGVHRRYERRAGYYGSGYYGHGYGRGYYGQGYYGHGYYGHGHVASQAAAPASLTCKEAADSDSRRIGRAATPTGTSASKPGRPRRPPTHNQQNKIEIAKKGTRLVPSHLLQAFGLVAKCCCPSPNPAVRTNSLTVAWRSLAPENWSLQRSLEGWWT